MADGVKGAVQNIGEAVVKPVAEEFGKAVEQGIQTVVQGPQNITPQQKPLDVDQGRQLKEQKELAEARRKIAWWKSLGEAQREVREQEKQKKLQAQQSFGEAQDKQNQIKQFEVVKKKQDIALAAAQRKVEIKRGVGG